MNYQNLIKKISAYRKNKNFLLVILKLSYDVLLLTLLTYAAMLMAEGALPGFISTRLSFAKLTVFLLTIMLLISYLGLNLNYSHNPLPTHKNKILPFLIVFSFLLIGNSLLKFSFWENLIITLTTLFIFFLFYQLFFFPSKKD